MSSRFRWPLVVGISIVCIVVAIVIIYSQGKKMVVQKSDPQSQNVANNVADTTGMQANSDQTYTGGAWSPGPAAQIPNTDELNKLTVTPRFTEDAVVSLAKVPNYSAINTVFGIKLSPAEEKYLLENHFLLLPVDRSSLKTEGGFDEMLAAFDRVRGYSSATQRAPENAKLVTPDVALHAYHRFFENTLEELEKHELYDSLRGFLEDVSGNIEKNYFADLTYQVSPAPAAKNLERVSAQIAVARTLLENHGPAKPSYFTDSSAEAAFAATDKNSDSLGNAEKILNGYIKHLPAAVQASARGELKNIYEASGVQPSPLTGEYKDDVKDDYTQYTPRSHYNKLSQLRAYFRAMMYLGRKSYFLKNNQGIGDANLVWLAMSQKNEKSGRLPLDAWRRIMGVTGFYAGASDDIGYPEWTNYLQKSLGTIPMSSERLVSAEVLDAQIKNISMLRGPRILSDIVVSDEVPGKTKDDLLRESLSFRIFGQRFTYDAWVLNDLTAGDEKTKAPLPSMPSALFVSAALGDARAVAHVKNLLVKERGFSAEMADAFHTGAMVKKQNDLAAVKNTEWFGSLSSAWVYLLGSLTHSYSAGYPLYMQAASFADKQIQTFLGSYTELKHDTVLYAKQSYTELGGGGGDESKLPPVPKGFVEPNLIFWRKLAALVTYNQQLFKQYGVFSDHPATERLREFGEIVAFYNSLAEKELTNQPISEAEYEKLRTTNLGFMGEPFDGSDASPKDWQTALVTDIHTDGVSKKILYEGTLRPYLMLVVVANEKSPRVVVGTAFNHVEFTKPIGPRATDEDWRVDVYDKKVSPPKNFWYDSLLAK